MDERLYAIRIEETLARSVAVRATSLQEALDKLEKIYCDEGIVLDADDYDDTRFVPHPICEEDNYVVSEEEAEQFGWDTYGGNEDG